MQGPPRNLLVEEALLLAAAAALHAPAARAALLGRPGAVDSLVAMLRRTCQHATQDQQASSCATLIGAALAVGAALPQVLVSQQFACSQWRRAHLLWSFTLTANVL